MRRGDRGMRVCAERRRSEDGCVCGGEDRGMSVCAEDECVCGEEGVCVRRGDWGMKLGEGSEKRRETRVEIHNA